MFFSKDNTALWIVDIQEKLFPKMERAHEVLEKMCFILEAAKILKLPIVITEQYPQGLGPTIDEIKSRLPQEQKIYSKTFFSGYFDKAIKDAVDALHIQNWILIGIEAHICILQTAKDLSAAGKHVSVAIDAVSSKSVYDFSTALDELRDSKIRLSSVETLIFELVRDALCPEFKEILALVKEYA